MSGPHPAPKWPLVPGCESRSGHYLGPDDILPDQAVRLSPHVGRLVRRMSLWQGQLHMRRGILAFRGEGLTTFGREDYRFK